MDFFEEGAVSVPVNANPGIYKPIVKRGNNVVIIKCPCPSSCGCNKNIYKGYVGEIREYVSGADTATVFLHAFYSNNTILFPIEQLKVIDIYKYHM